MSDELTELPFGVFYMPSTWEAQGINKIIKRKNMPSKPKMKNGIHISYNKKKELIYSLWWNGRSVNIGGESYKRKAGVMNSLKRAQMILNDFFLMNNIGLLHDNTTLKK